LLIALSLLSSFNFMDPNWVKAVVGPPNTFAQTNSPQIGTAEGSKPFDSTNATIREFPVPAGSRPHDVAPLQNLTFDGDVASASTEAPVWYTAQRLGELGKLSPETGETHLIPGGNVITFGINFSS
jgi:streptogramin lyase